MTLHINVAADFTPIPVGRRRREGNKSAEEFREEILYPKFCEALKHGKILEVDFTGMRGLSGSFMEVVFAGLIRDKGFDADDVLRTIKFLPEDTFFDFYIEAGMGYIEQARQEVIRRA